MAFVDDECDNPAANGYFDADIRKQEERHEVDGPETEDLLVLVHASQGLFGLLMWRLTDVLKTCCCGPSISWSAIGRLEVGWGIAQEEKDRGER